MSNARDRALIDYVQVAIRSGANTVQVPSQLCEDTSAEAREAVRDLCKVNEVSLEVVVL